MNFYHCHMAGICSHCSSHEILIFRLSYLEYSCRLAGWCVLQQRASTNRRRASNKNRNKSRTVRLRLTCLWWTMSRRRRRTGRWTTTMRLSLRNLCSTGVQIRSPHLHWYWYIHVHIYKFIWRQKSWERIWGAKKCTCVCCIEYYGCYGWHG